MSSDSELFALVGRIHVLMRRSLNRITDVDYLRENKDYARTIAALAEGSGNEELAQLAGRLRQMLALDPQPQGEAAGGAEPPPADQVKYLFTLR